MFLGANASDNKRGIAIKKGLCAASDVQIYVGRRQWRGMYPGAFRERTARATGGGLM